MALMPAPLPHLSLVLDSLPSGGSSAAVPLPSLSTLFDFGSGRVLPGEVGSFALNAQAASLKFNRRLDCAVGSFALSGQDATLDPPGVAGGIGGAASLPSLSTLFERAATDPLMLGAVGAFSVNGQTAELRRGVTISCAVGSFTVSGAPAQSDFQLTCAVGSYALTGQAASLLRSYTNLAGAYGSFALTGLAAGLNYEQVGTYGLPLDAGYFALTGQAAGMTWTGRLLSAAYGSFTVNGQAATLRSTAGIWEIVSSENETWTTTTPASTTWN